MKDVLLGYLQTARDAVVWKLEGLSEYDIRRPLVPSGTNLLGLVKHLTCGELAYFGPVFGRLLDEPNPWFDAGAEDGADMIVGVDERREDVVAAFRRACSLADGTIADLDLDSTGTVSWWGDERVTLGQIMVHVTTETCRHAGHADVLRELVDGEVGFATWGSNIPAHDGAWWQSRREGIEQSARRATASP